MIYVGMDISSKSFMVHAIDSKNKVVFKGEIRPTRQGLRQLMTGARKFDLQDHGAAPDRNDLVALTREAASRTGIAFISAHDAQEAESIIKDAETA
mgnify:CR=1 FL=1